MREEQKLRQPEKPLHLQMNLSLHDMPATAIPSDKQRELASALMELLISATRETAEHPDEGGNDEPETHA